MVDNLKEFFRTVYKKVASVLFDHSTFQLAVVIFVRHYIRLRSM